MFKENLIPYIEAVKKILQGEYIDNLEDIRQQCNSNFLKSLTKKGSLSRYEEKPDIELFILSFATDAENKILKGEKIEKAYHLKGDEIKKIFNLRIITPKILRYKSKKFLEKIVNEFDESSPLYT